jgi:hypothetical protein
MLLMAHLFAGVVIGLVLLELTGQRWTLAAAAIGAIVPDLVDKPLGHLMLGGELDNGRIVCHTLLVLMLCLAIGILSYRRNGSWVGMAFAMGVLSHQCLDLMFLTPEAWFWPGLGPFQRGDYPDYFSQSAVSELTTPYEWLFLVAGAAVLAYAYGRRLWGIPSKIIINRRRQFDAVLLAAGALLLAWGAVAASNSITIEAVNCVLAGLICLAGWRVLKESIPACSPQTGRSASPGH